MTKRKLSEEHKAKIGAAHRGMKRPTLLGKKLSPEHAEKVRIKLIGRPVSEETRRKISENHKRKGIKPSAEATKRSMENRVLSGPGHRSWKTGLATRGGYVVRQAPDHPSVQGKTMKYVYEHRLVVEATLGRYLAAGEVVHHIDGDKLNNHPDNLQVCANQAEHRRVHIEHDRQKAYDEGFAAGLAQGQEARGSDAGR